MKRNKRIRVTVMALLIVLSCYSIGYCDVFSSGEALVEATRAFFVKISTAVAVVGIALGACTIKFANGDHGKIAKGSAAIKWSIAAWALVNGAMLIFSTVQTYIS